MYEGYKEVPHYSGTICIALSILLVPCMDVICVVIGRIKRHQSPFLPDKTHIHHKFMAMGFSPRRSLVLIQAISLTFITCTAIMVYYFRTNTNIILALQVIAWTALNCWFSRINNLRKVDIFSFHFKTRTFFGHIRQIPMPQNLCIGIVFFEPFQQFQQCFLLLRSACVSRISL